MIHFSPSPWLYLITGGRSTKENFDKTKPDTLRIIATAVEAGIDFIQIREKQLPSTLLFELVKSSAAITRATSTKLLVNGRPDIAIAAQVDGVHLPDSGLPVEVVRRTFSESLMIGRSVHSADEAARAFRDGADYVIYGNVFASPGKSEPRGIAELERVCRSVGDHPVIAVGGIDRMNFQQVIGAGAAGAAAIGALSDPASIRSFAAVFEEVKEKGQ